MPDRIELKSGQTTLFIGDSITDTGRPEAAYRPFGYSYNIRTDWMRPYCSMNIN
jgi:hypothetical protein